MNQALVAKSSRDVASGDILLLTSRGAEAALSKIYQATKRGEPAKYTHVALVISLNEVVDAMPSDGVDFRRWADMEAQYDLDHCCVARHIQLASNPEAFRLLYKRATFYYKQPYKLQQLFSPPQELVDQAGIVCSQFVALLLKDVGIDASARPVFESLPIDIDKATRASADWVQFPLLEYEMCSKSRPGEEDGRNTSDPVNDLLRNMRVQWFRGSRDVQSVDDLMADYTRRLASGQMSHHELSGLVAGIRASPSVEADALSAASPFSGASLLLAWKSWFINYKEQDPVFMHGERRAANHQEHCSLFRKQVEELESMVADQAARFKQFATHLGELTEHAQQTQRAQLQRAMEPFCGESEEEVKERMDGYAGLAAQLREWLGNNDVDPKMEEDARKSLRAIVNLDFHRLVYFTGLKMVAKVLGPTDELNAQQAASPKTS